MLVRLSALLAASLLLPAATARFDNDFSAYPDGAQPCLEEADKNSGCNGNTVPVMNGCLCNTGDSPFLEDTARCVGKESKSDLKRTYSRLKVNCDGSDTSMDISEDEFLAFAEEDSETTSTTSSSSTTDANPTETETEEPPANTDDEVGDEDGGGLSSGATIGIAVAATAVGVSIIAAAIFLFLRRRRMSRAADESNPMLGGSGPDARTSVLASTVRDSSYVSPYQDSDISKTASGVAAWGPDSFNAAAPVGHQGYNSGSPPQHLGPTPPMGNWDGGARPPSWDPQAWGAGVQAGAAGYAPVGAQGQQGGGMEVYELASTERPAVVEMPGSHPGPNQR